MPTLGTQLMDYDLADYTSSVMGNFLSCITIYFSIVTAYVIAAFAAGGKLSRLQLFIVNSSFTIAAGVIGPLTVLSFSRFVELARRLQDADNTPLIDFSYALAVLVLILYLGSLAFMYSVRRKPSEA